MEPGTITDVTPDNLDAIREQQQERADRSREASERIRAIRAEGVSDRGLARVTVDGSALLVDLEFSRGASSSASILGTLVKQAHDRAVEEWHRQVEAITEDVLGDQPHLRATIQAVAARGVEEHTGPEGDDPEAPDRPRR